MRLHNDNKPSLKELFDSKKLDHPNPEFWEDFQDQVRSKTLSSVVTQKSNFSGSKIIILSSSLIVICGICFFSFFKSFDDSSTQLHIEKANSFVRNSQIELSKGNDLLVIDERVLLSSFNPKNFDDYASNSNLHVEQHFHSPSLETTFQQRILAPANTPSDDINFVVTF